MKFNRNYRLTIQAEQGGVIIIEPPFTIEFNIIRAKFATANSATISIYNLSPKTRNRIFKDRFIIETYKRVVLEAGYGDNLSTIFIGNIFSALSARRGSEIVTTLNCQDGGFDITNTTISSTIAAGATATDILSALSGYFTHVVPGVISAPEDKYNRPIVLGGNVFELIQVYAKGQAFIDLEKLYVLQNNQVLVNEAIPFLDAETGLLETPAREDAFLTITTLFEPRVIIAQIIEIDSPILPQYNGQYQVIGLEHRGIISDAVNGECRSIFHLLLANQLYGEYEPL